MCNQLAGPCQKLKFCTKPGRTQSLVQNFNFWRRPATIITLCILQFFRIGLLGQQRKMQIKSPTQLGGYTDTNRNLRVPISYYYHLFPYGESFHKDVCCELSDLMGKEAFLQCNFLASLIRIMSAWFIETSYIGFKSHRYRQRKVRPCQNHLFHPGWCTQVTGRDLQKWWWLVWSDAMKNATY